MRLGEWLVRAEDVAIRPMRDDPADYRLLARWLTDARVLEFYLGRDNPYPYERAVTKYRPRVRGEDPVRPCIIVHEGREVGFAQYYAAGRKEYQLEDDAATYGIDLFIGEPELWGTGVGSRALSALVGYVFRELGARRLVIDPMVDNGRAIRSYEKCGFRKVKVLRQHELHEGRRRDCWLMAIEKEER